MLYGYLLSQSEFKIESPVETSSPDRRYSFEAYAQLLLLMLEMSGHNVVRNRTTPASVRAAVADAPYYESRTSAALMANDEVQQLINQYGETMSAFDRAVPELAIRLQNTSAYREFRKIRKPEAGDEIAFWTQVIRNVVIKTPEVVAALRQSERFTVRGMELAAKMLTDTLSDYSDTRNVFADSRRDLEASLDKAFELYHALLWLPVALTRAQAQRLEAGKEKLLPTPDDLNPDMRFAENGLAHFIEENEEMQQYLKENPAIWWEDDPILLQALLDRVLQSNAYKAYMEAPGDKTLAEDCELWRSLLKNVIIPCDDFVDALEAKSIFWNDDVEVMGSFAMKTIKQIGRGVDNLHLCTQYKDAEDANFGTSLFGQAVAHRGEYRQLLDEFINAGKWDTERLALMDIAIIITALAEIINFPNIPLTVSVNEYVEIANRYSNPRSGAFINGIIAAIARKLRAEGKLLKEFSDK
jgi:N utilization substance protein B